MAHTMIFAMIVSFALSATVRAEETGTEVKGRAYQLLCVPGSEKALSEDEAAEALEYRLTFHQFLRNPAAILAQVQRDKEEGSLLGTFGAALMLAITCGAADALKEDIATHGCKDENGASASPAMALAACAPVIVEFRK